MNHWILAVAITDPEMYLMIFDAKEKLPIRAFRNLKLQKNDFFRRLYFEEGLLTAVSRENFIFTFDVSLPPDSTLKNLQRLEIKDQLKFAKGSKSS
jgi:hypothetical protein